VPRLAEALDALLVVLKDKPNHLRTLIDDKRGVVIGSLVGRLFTSTRRAFGRAR
jgi:hypothetical protein